MSIKRRGLQSLKGLGLCLALCLSACGFHLRGQYQLPAPLYRLYIQTASPYDPFVQALEQVLHKMKVVVPKTAQEANVVLVVNAMSSSQALVSSSTTSQVNTYAITYTLDFSLQDPQGKILLAAQRVSASQSYTISSSQAITGSAQAQQIQSQLYQDVIYQLFNLLSSKQVKAALSSDTSVMATGV